MKNIYDLSLLHNILKGKRYISDAKVLSYEEHKKDLKSLKDYIKDNCPEKYVKIFGKPIEKDQKTGKEKAIANYSAYIGMNKNKSNARCTQKGFYDFLKKKVDLGGTDMLTKIEQGTFLPLQISGENGVIPYQIHKNELEAILKNAEKYFPFLKGETDGKSVSQKIISLMTFRIPYFVGPLTDRETKYSWMVKCDGYKTTPIRPWNFEEIVDLDKTEQRFISRMTNKCTYMRGEDVLPNSSLLYSEFTFLNELNNLKVNGEKNLKANEIIFQLAHEEKKLTLKKCCKELIKRGVLPKDSRTEDVFGGTDGDFKNSLSSYIDFKRIVGDKVNIYSEYCEQIIIWITLISDKKRLKALIKKEYSSFFDNREIEAMCGLNYVKWGRLSKAFLTELKEIDSNGEVGTQSIIERMRSLTENLMQLLSQSYGYTRALEVHNKSLSEDDDRVTYRSVENLYCSPSVKRPIWSAIKIVREIQKILGAPPKKIFIETIRQTAVGGNKSKYKSSRFIVDKNASRY